MRESDHKINSTASMQWSAKRSYSNDMAKGMMLFAIEPKRVFPKTQKVWNIDKGVKVPPSPQQAAPLRHRNDSCQLSSFPHRIDHLHLPHLLLLCLHIFGHILDGVNVTS
jgi:hypothetical protein